MESHLNDDQIEVILRFASGSEDRRIVSVAADEAFLHVENCEICRTRVGCAKASMGRLAQVQSLSAESRMEGCPPDEVWLEIAAGILISDTEGYMDHAAQCDHCGPQLRQALADLAAEVTQEEETRIAALPSSTVKWQESMAERLTQYSPAMPKKRSPLLSLFRGGVSFPLWAHWALSGVAGIVVAAVVGLSLHDSGPKLSTENDLIAINKLLVESYSERRTIMFRFPGAAHATYSPTMGQAESDFDFPLSLHQAQTAVQVNIPKHRGDSGWLDAKARVELLKGNSSPAITLLREALAANPDSVSIQLDLAAAYFESGRSGGSGDFPHSIELLKTILDREPTNQTALFNLALVCQRAQDFVCAKEAWEKYLLLDSNGDWADEARDHLADVVRATAGQVRKESEQLLGQEQFEASIKRDNKDSWRLVDSRIEDYLGLALLEWMPNVDTLSSTGGVPYSSKKDALITLGVILEKAHHDRFLLDLITGIGRPGFPTAVDSLRKSILANASGDPALGLTEARESETDFRKAGNTAGVLRARFESVYAAQFLMKTTNCIEESDRSIAAADRRGYSWLSAQFSLEKAYCSNISGNPRIARAQVTKAMTRASNARYEDVHLRALVGMAAIDSESGSMQNAWRLTADGLRSFWSGNGSTTRGYSFYVLQDALADANQLWQFDVVVIDEALHLVPQVHDPLVEAAIRFRFSGAYMRLGRPRMAQQQLNLATELLDSAPRSAANANARMRGTIELAQVENELGHSGRSIDLLRQVSRLSQGRYEVFDSLEYFRTLGQSTLKLGQTQLAKNAFTSAITVCEQGAGTLASARDRLSWIRGCVTPYYALIELEFKAGSSNKAFSTYQRLRRVTMNTLLGPEILRKIPQNGTINRIRDGSNKVPAIEHSPSGILIVTYAALDDGLLIWTHENQGSSVHWVNISGNELVRASSRFLAECEEPSSNTADLRRDAKNLYRWLIAPIEGSLGSIDRLVVQPDSPIANIPYEALIGPDDSFFGEHFSVLVSPGGDRVTPRKSVGPLVNQPALILDSEFSDAKHGILPLESAKREVETVGSLLNKPSYLVGNSATQSALESHLPKMTIFHYVGHSRVDLGGNGLLLRSEQGNERLVSSFVSWGASNVSPALFRQCRLAVLSACSTANGEQGEWIDRESLVFALIAAGVPKVIASHWNVDSNTTSVMMEAFYRHLRDGDDVSVALHHAQADVRRNPATANPFYWAAFSVFGDT